jgi:Uri superfamily endonuclease
VKGGAYVLRVNVKRPLTLFVGALGQVFIPAGCYAYVGSARRGIVARVSRHKRLAMQKEGKLHWHIDYLLMNPHTQWDGEVMLEDGIECVISGHISTLKGATAPVPGFGSSDCRSGCKAHLYLLSEGNPRRNRSVTAKSLRAFSKAAGRRRDA